MNKTSIEWTHRPGSVGMTWNPIRARIKGVRPKRKSGGTFCTKISPGCTHCYASSINKRFGTGEEFTVPNLEHHEFFIDEDILLAPILQKKPATIFVGDMFDLFHEAIPDEFIDRVYAVAAIADWHTYQFLTKRADRLLAYKTAPGRVKAISAAALDGQKLPIGPGFYCADDNEIYEVYWYKPKGLVCFSEDFGSAGTGVDDRHDCHVSVQNTGIKFTGLDFQWPLVNEWVGVSVENQEYADKRIPLLMQTPAAIRFLSVEPQLGPVDLSCFLGKLPEDGAPYPGKIDWVIDGGESGTGARSFDLVWAESLLGQCRAAGTAFFMKQMGRNARWEGIRLAGLDPKGGTMADWPKHLRVREFPA